MANYYCKYCGVKYGSVASLTSANCSHHPDGSYNKHVLYEGSEKSQYTCKYCGVKYSTIGSMISAGCSKNPNGKKRHSPAL